MAQNKRRGRRRVAENKAPQRKPMKKRVVESQDKFQQMLEFLVNEDRAKAEELFHEIVVEKSRSIYEGLLEDEEEEVDEADDEDTDEATEKSAAEQMREYVEKVTPKMGDNGANTKSVVAGKNDMGGTASNLVQGGDEKGMKASAPKEDSAGNVNVPGGKASKSMSSMPKGHGAEKKGAGDAAPDKKSMIGS